MKKTVLIAHIIFLTISLKSQSLYYPPNIGNAWEITEAHALGWDTTLLADLRTYLDTTGAKSFMLLKDGRIVLEYYFNDHSATKPWYWASAGKSLTSVLVGCAEADGKLQLMDPASKYLGNGWTSCTREQEDKITIFHQITMTSGLDDNGNSDCTEPACLKFKAPAGTRWAYHNPPYTLLDGVIEGATGQELNNYLRSRLSNQTGINGLYIKNGYNNVFYSSARSMARFGLLVLGKGFWNGVDIIKNKAYVDAMTQSSQNINKSYGYLWWLNGKESFMLPSSQMVFPWSLISTAPADMFAALGKNDQKLYIVPSENLVILRMGEKATGDETQVPIIFDIVLWEKLSAIMKKSNSVTNEKKSSKAWFNVQNSIIQFESDVNIKSAMLVDINGRIVLSSENSMPIDYSHLPAALYYLLAFTENQQQLAASLFCGKTQ